MSLTYGERTETQAKYSEFLRARVQQGDSLFPTGIEGFTAGVKAERERILALLQAHICPSCEQGDEVHGACSATLDDIALIEMESE